MRKKILIIGGQGFIGLHLVKKLVALKENITVLDLPGTNSIKSIDFLKKTRIVTGSVTDFEIIKKNVKGKDYIINLAAVINKGTNIKNPFCDLDVNCRGQLNVLEACRQINNTTTIIWLGTRSQFGKIDQKIKISENHSQKPVSLYGINKQTGENYCKFYAKAYGLNTIVIRPSSVYGPPVIGENNTNIINLFIKKAIANDIITTINGGIDYKDYLYVEDLVDAIIALIKKDIKKGAFNIGSSKSLKIVDIFNAIIKQCGGGYIKNIQKSKHHLRHDEGNTYMDTTKIRKATGWHPKISLKKGIQKTINYYKGGIK